MSLLAPVKCRLLLCLVVVTMWIRADLPAAEIAAPGDEIESPLQMAPWIRLFARAAMADTVYSQFREERYVPVRKTPTVLLGEMRFSSAHGLSLAYTAPERRIMIMDDAGMLLRDAKGRQKAMAPDAKAAGLPEALHAVLGFDWEEIQDRFVVYGAREDGSWRLDLVPREADLAKRLGTMTLWGESDLVQKIQFGRAKNQRVVISILGHQYNREFSAEELRRYFR